MDQLILSLIATMQFFVLLLTAQVDQKQAEIPEEMVSEVVVQPGLSHVGIGSFTDDFEMPTQFSDLDAWKQEQLVRGTLQRVSDPVATAESSNTVLKAEAGGRTALGQVGKADLIKRFYPLEHGTKISVSMRVFFPVGARLDKIHLMDIECGSCGLDSNPGPRLYLSNGTLHIERGKIGLSQSISASIDHAIESGKWYSIVWELVGGEDEAGINRVFLDDVPIIDQVATNIITQSVADQFGLTLEGNHYDSIQVGLTANSNSGNEVLYIDDVEITWIET